MKISLSSPDITDLEREYVLSVLNTPNLSLGPLVKEFEVEFAKYIGSRYAVAVNSGTSGLHLSIKALNIKEGDSVITTPFSFVASANCILFERACPIFVDIDPTNYNIDPEKIEDAIRKIRGPKLKIKAILPVHVFGNPCNMDQINYLGKRYDIEVIEDACEAIGAEWKGKRVGTFGKVGVFAFYPNKQITTGEGGMIVTNDNTIAELCKSLRNQGRSQNGEWLNHERLGYNYRLSDINCALGLAQLKRIDTILRKRNEVAAMYHDKLMDIEEVHIPYEQDGICNRSWFVYVIQLADRYSRRDRDNILEGLRAAGIGCNNYFTPIHLQPFYREIFGFKEGDFPITEHVSERTIALPFFNNLGEEQINYVVERLEKLL